MTYRRFQKAQLAVLSYKNDRNVNKFNRVYTCNWNSAKKTKTEKGRLNANYWHQVTIKNVVHVFIVLSAEP